jgi:hypothetical protein
MGAQQLLCCLSSRGCVIPLAVNKHHHHRALAQEPDFARTIPWLADPGAPEHFGQMFLQSLARTRMTVNADHGLPVGVATLRAFTPPPAAPAQPAIGRGRNAALVVRVAQNAVNVSGHTTKCIYSVGSSAPPLERSVPAYFG